MACYGDSVTFTDKHNIRFRAEEWVSLLSAGAIAS
jgi:hypothetical protein